MNRVTHTAARCVLVFGLLLPACSSVTAPVPTAQPSQESPLVSGPLSSQDSNEARAIRLLTREQDARIASCMQDRSCDRVHFIRALLFLSGNQEDLAAKHFQKVVTIAPKSSLASLSVAWLKMLKDHPSERSQDQVFAHTAQWLIQDLWTREQVLKEEVKHRDRELEALSDQLEALKQIDMEMAEKPQFMRPKARFSLRPEER